MHFDEYEQERRFHEIWDSVSIERSVQYGLFTFGESMLPYFLVCGSRQSRTPVSITKGEVRITRPAIITPDNTTPEFRNFFQEQSEEQIVQFLLARTADFSHLQFENQSGPARIVSDSVQEAVAKLNCQLDDEEEDQVAILSAPPDLGGVALLRYAAERVWSSGPGNVQELREHGFLP